MSPSSFIDSKARSRILKGWSEERDTYRHDKSAMGWTDISEGGSFPYDHKRPLNLEDAEKAIAYITAIVAKYPVQIRYTMAKPLWLRFTQGWCETGDLNKALRGI